MRRSTTSKRDCFSEKMSSLVWFMTFDILTILISLADVVTDIIVLYQWHSDGHFTYFWISLGILSAANLSYYILFVRRLWDVNNNLLAFCCNIFIVLPLSPLIPYCIYFYESPHFCSRFTDFVNKIVFEYTTYPSATGLPPELLRALQQMDDVHFDLMFKKLVRHKLDCHIGFILETFLESFPQSILQMIAILQLSSTNESAANIIIVSSIFLSLISIAFKSILLLAVDDLWSSIFNWMATTIDFYAIFVFVSWLFLEIEDNDYVTNTINLQYIVLVLCITTTVPLVVSFTMFLVLEEFDPRSNTYWENVLGCAIVSLLLISPIGVIIAQITCCIFVAFYVDKFGLSRCTDTKNGEYWAPIFKFLHRSDGHRDRLVKVLIINRMVELPGHKDFHEWIDNLAVEGFREIKSFKDLRENIHRDPVLEQVMFMDITTASNRIGKVLERAISMIFLPLFLIGRVLHLLFPVLVYGVNLCLFGWSGIYLLHHVLTLLFIALLMVLVAVSREVMYLAHCLYHIGFAQLPPTLFKNKIVEVDEYYVDIMQMPVIIEFFDERFGEDVSRLIMYYLKCIKID